MLKEIILSVLVSAASSGVFLDTPKKAFTSMAGLAGEINISLFQDGLESPTAEAITRHYTSQEVSGRADGANAYKAEIIEDNKPFLQFTWDYSDFSYSNTVYGSITFWFDPNYENEVDYLWENFGSWFSYDGNAYDDGGDHGSYSGDNQFYYGYSFIRLDWQDNDVYPDEQGYYGFTLDLTPDEYALDKNLINCTGGENIPDYFGSTGFGWVTALFNANSNYFFDSENPGNVIVASDGVEIENVQFSSTGDPSPYDVRWHNQLQLAIRLLNPVQGASYSLTIKAQTAFYNVAYDLTKCAIVSPEGEEITDNEAQRFVFKADDGNGFNKNEASYQVSGGYETNVAYDGLLYGAFYDTLILTVKNGTYANTTIKVTAVSYEPDSYQQGWKDGDASGYERGHRDGMIAGDSYGIWNWLKQAAATTGEFLSIPLLPGFSIGGLLTALAGLAIIWLFIKGFLFKG